MSIGIGDNCPNVQHVAQNQEPAGAASLSLRPLVGSDQLALPRLSLGTCCPLLLNEHPPLLCQTKHHRSLSAPVRPSLMASLVARADRGALSLSPSQPLYTTACHHCGAAGSGISVFLSSKKFLEGPDSMFESSLLPTSGQVQGTEKAFNTCVSNGAGKTEGGRKENPGREDTEEEGVVSAEQFQVQRDRSDGEERWGQREGPRQTRGRPGQGLTCR